MADEPRVSVRARYIGGAIFEAKEMENDGGGTKLKYNAILVFDDVAGPDEAKKVLDIRKKAVFDKWGKKPAGLNDYTVREGDDEEYTGTYGHKFINAGGTRAPRTLKKEGGEIVNVTRDDDVIYPGCYVIASVSAYCMDKNKEKRIPKPLVTLSLRGLMKWKDGPRLDDQASDAEFDGFDTEEDDDFGEEEDTRSSASEQRRQRRTKPEPDDFDEDDDDL